MIATLYWLLPALVPCAMFGIVLRRTSGRRTPASASIATFVLGGIGAAVALFVTRRAEALTGLDLRVSEAGQSGALVFLFLFVAPVRESAKVAAVWPAFVAKRLGDPLEGVIYAMISALGFGAVETAWILASHPSGASWLAREALALPANLFFAGAWGYALGRARHDRQRWPIFPTGFVVAIVAHGVYTHLVFGRGIAAVLGLTPLLAAMAIVAWLLVRDLRVREGRSSLIPSLPSRRLVPSPPSLAAVRAALRAEDEPVRLGWILLGALVTLGAMITGVAAGVLVANAFHLDLSRVDDHDIAAASPALLLGLGLLLSFPVSGWLVARAAAIRTLLEPTLATVLALFITMVALAFAAPVTVVFALAISPIAWVLSCLGAWAGRRD